MATKLKTLKIFSILLKKNLHLKKKIIIDPLRSASQYVCIYEISLLLHVDGWFLKILFCYIVIST
jgi:hypothetical protein